MIIDASVLFFFSVPYADLFENEYVQIGKKGECYYCLIAVCEFFCLFVFVIIYLNRCKLSKAQAPNATWISSVFTLFNLILTSVFLCYVSLSLYIVLNLDH